MGSRSRVLLVGIAVLAAFQVPGSSLAAEQDRAEPRLLSRFQGDTGEITGAPARALRSGPLSVDPAAVAAAKAEAPAVDRSPVPLSVSPTPTILESAEGIHQEDVTPSDSTGAIGTTRYIEVVNSMVGIYDRNLNLIADDTLNTWWDTNGNSFDPQVIWDPTTKRFYYAGDVVFVNANLLAFGFSTTASPGNLTSDWCNYFVNYGKRFPDYPKLGDSKFFAIIGVNVFRGNNFLGSDVVAISKPPAGTSCPDPTSFDLGIGEDLAVGGTVHSTPVPANEIDTNRIGWVLTVPDSTSASSLGRFKVTRDTTTGDPVIQTSGTSIPVSSFSVPPNAPQKDGSFNLDTLDGRLTQAVAAKDPDHGKGLQIWTQHTISGGAGAAVRWYEIVAPSGTVTQSGTVSDGSLYLFNGAVSPDRVVKGKTKAFGQNMVLGFNTSSSDTYPAIQMVGKRGADDVSARVLVKSSPGHDEDFACQHDGFCRWGDYAAATPDPGASTGAATGVVWLTNMWTQDADTTGGSDGTSWRTWNWSAMP